ncbi:glycosyltransferase [Cyanobium sp. NS01]|uniref:glycosyltransferase n=1 Tax=Cyanobium sp. NS01 TaxID=261284 RepID=UPI0016440C3D|nr:glycosyltransferase [Cyanobium sp. NS01]QNI71245.1 glycosyl transferase 2 family protein [Cyanobium sp. NS01]
MSREAFERGNWQAVIEAHPLESHDPGEWLRYGVVLLQTIQPGPDVGKQQQQAALAFVQAQKEGATAEAVAGAQRRSVLLSLEQALSLVGLPEQPALQTLLQQPLRADVRTGPPVTLTAISSRLATLPAVLESLRQQTYRPAQVHLHLSQDPHLLDQGIAADDPLLEEITADGWVQLHWVANLGPYRKIIPFLQEDGYAQAGPSQTDGDLFITVDDDTLYPPRFIEYLVRNYERHGCVVAHRGRRIRLAEGEASGTFRPYAEWHDGVREPRLANLPTGQSGVLYRRSWFPRDLELEAALALAPTHDDLWLHWLTARQGVQAVILQPNAAAKTKELAFPAASREPIAQKQTLWHAFNGPAGGNDDAVVAVQAYWQARGFDLAALLAEEQERQADFY